MEKKNKEEEQFSDTVYKALQKKVDTILEQPTLADPGILKFIQDASDVEMDKLHKISKQRDLKEEDFNPLASLLVLVALLNSVVPEKNRIDISIEEGHTLIGEDESCMN